MVKKLLLGYQEKLLLGLKIVERRTLQKLLLRLKIFKVTDSSRPGGPHKKNFYWG